MTKEETAKRISIMQAYLDGKTIQFLCGVQWMDVEGEPSWSNNVKYRIKEEPQYRPYANAKEFLQAQKEHGPYILEKAAVDRYLNPVMILSDGIVFWFSNHTVTFKYSEIDKKPFYWQDGTPCRVIEAN